MSAAVGHSIYGFRMVRDVEGIQFTEDRYLRARFSCLNISVEARNVSCFDECVSKCLVFLCEIVMSLPLGVAGLRMSPDPALRVEVVCQSWKYLLKYVILDGVRRCTGTKSSICYSSGASLILRQET